MLARECTDLDQRDPHLRQHQCEILGPQLVRVRKRRHWKYQIRVLQFNG